MYQRVSDVCGTGWPPNGALQIPGNRLGSCMTSAVTGLLASLGTGRRKCWARRHAGIRTGQLRQCLHGTTADATKGEVFEGRNAA